jgi:pseudouridine-5'-phosphate glycosidase
VALAQPPPEASALSKEEFAEAFHQAAEEAQVHRVAGKDLTPFLLTRLAVHTKGKSLEVNRDLVVANARLAAQVANALQARIEA